MTDFKIPSEGGIIKPPIEADERIIYDYPAYYYNKLRADQHYARDFAHRLLGVTYETAYEPFFHADNKIKYLCRIDRAKQFMAENNIEERKWT